MKLGISMLCVSGFIEARHWEEFELARAHGYDGVDIPLISGTPEHYERLARLLDELNLDRTTTLIMPDAAMNPASDDPDSRRHGVERLDWALDCAAALGASSIGGPFHAPLLAEPGPAPSDTGIRHCVDAHRHFAEQAEQLGIQVSLEPQNRDECAFLHTMAEAADYAQRVDHENFRILYDSFHAQREENDPCSAAHAIRDHLGVVHLSEHDRGIPGRGAIDFAALLRTLKQDHFDNWLVVESFPGQLPDISLDVREWQTHGPDLGTLFKESAQLVREQWEAA